MKEKIVFCEECRKKEAYTVEKTTLRSVLKGKEYVYNGENAKCDKCGVDVYVAEIEDRNLKALYNIYRQKNALISLEKILEIPQKYNIGKRPLSLLLGWGETTYTRYCDGDMPTKQYSDILQKIYDEPTFYLDILEKNRANLKSRIAYEKSKRAVMSILNNHKSGNCNVDDVIDYILYRCEDITPLALQKVLYYVQGFHYAFMERFLFDSDCEAWVHGPVYREIYNRYSEYKFDSIEGNGEFDISVFTDTEKAIIDSVIKNICCYSGKILEDFTHSELPWLKTRGELPIEAPSNRIISKKVIGEYFIAVKQKYNMLVPDDIEYYSKVMFERTIK